MRLRWLAGLASAMALYVAIPAIGEVTQAGDVIISFKGGVYPKALPRDTPAPVSIRISGVIKSAKSDAELPQLQGMSVALNSSGGQIFDRGLGACSMDQLRARSGQSARQACGDALVGEGSAVVELVLPDQTPYSLNAKINYFNGVRMRGQRQLLAQVYIRTPPISYVVPFEINKQAGRFGTVLSVKLPKQVGGFAHVRQFQMTLKRTFFYRGRKRSYLSASCAAPAGFPGAVYPLAKLTYDFDNGRSVTSTIIRSCSVQKEKAPTPGGSKGRHRPSAPAS